MKVGKAQVAEVVVRQGVRYLTKDPERNLVALLDWAEDLARQPHHKRAVQRVRELMEEDTNWRRLAVRLLKETHPRVRERLAVNFFVNAGFLGVTRQYQMAERLGVSVPFALLIDPTERCNLQCTGCWAGDYEKTQELDFETIDRVIREGKDLGIYFIVVSGGEPLLKEKELLRLAETHNDVAFHVFTNGTLMDEQLVTELQRLGNMTFAISLEGFEASTDARRGPGVFRRVMRAMDLLREGGIPFGFSTTYTRLNTEEVASDEYMDMLLEKGCAFGWFFTYVPVGVDIDLDLMATPEQRALMYRQVRQFRATRPIFVADFWNDGEFSAGCIAGGKRYLHINAAGEVEPCAFIHYASCNIRDTSLVDALRSPLMRTYQRYQPFNVNMLRPCPLIDNPEMLARIVEESGAYPTQQESRVPASCLARSLGEYAHSWGGLADRLWNGS